MRRPRAVELMLMTAVCLWALNFTLTRYVLTHGLLPLVFSTVRYGAGALLFVAFALRLEGSLRLPRERWRWAAVAVLSLTLNQVMFVYSVRATTASTVALVLGATPMFAAMLGLALRTERPSSRFWLGSALSFAGVGLVALGSGGEVSGSFGGILLAVVAAATWAVYSVAVTPLMRDASAIRISAVVLPLSWLGIAAVGTPQVLRQDWGAVDVEVWLVVALSTVGALVVTNLLWYRILDRIGPARGTLATNVQPLIAVVFAVLLLSERLAWLQVAGGTLVVAGLLVARRRALLPQD